MFKQDIFLLETIAYGDLILKSEVFQESIGIVENSCSGTVTGNVFFGKAGVGKSTIASLVSSKPGLFEVGTSGQGTTTLGTWLSSSVTDGTYSQFADNQFQPVDDMPENIPSLVSLNDFYDNDTNLVFMDTEGLDYQTEYGDNYDVVTILPHTLIAENVFLLVRDRVNPAEVIELIDKLAGAAERTEGTLTHRNGKLFGKFYIVVNKAQDISKSDEEELSILKRNNPSLITKVLNYFTHGPEIVMLPLLQWNYEVQPDFNEDGFYLNYDHIQAAHPPLRDRMFYGLHKIAGHFVKGVPTDDMYPLKCETFEAMLQEMYDATTEDIIDINQLDYEWLLKEAKEELDEFVRQYDLVETGLTSEVLSSVCPEADSDLYNCIKEQNDLSVQDFYEKSLLEINQIFPKGEKDLIVYLNNDLFPKYVSEPTTSWFDTCSLLYAEKDVYTDDFLSAFESSDFFNQCQSAVNGKLTWLEWENCSKTCKSDDTCGVRIRLAEACIPEYAACNEVQVQREECNCNDCPPPEPEPEPGHYDWFEWEKCSQTCSSDGFCGVQVRYAKSCEPAGAICNELPVQRKDCGCQACPPQGQIQWHEWEKCSQSCSSDGTCGVQVRYAKSCTPETSTCSEIQIQRKDCGCNACPAPPPALTELPIGSIIPWVPKPSSSVSNTVNYNSYKGWIKCDGVEACSDGPFKSKKCTDLADRTLIGSYGSFKTLNVYGATFPDHKHPHSHTTNVSVLTISKALVIITP